MNRVTRAIVNKIRKHYDAAPQVEGEGLHIPTTNYCGPNTDLKHKGKFGIVKGKYLGLDSICRKHDYMYFAASKLDDRDRRFQMIQNADKEMIDEVNSLPSSSKNALATIAKFIIDGKFKLENAVGKNIIHGAGRELGEPDTLIVLKKSAPKKLVYVDPSDAFVKTNLTAQDVRLILNSFPEQNSVFFKHLKKDFLNNVDNLQLRLGSMTKDQITKWVSSNISSKNLKLTLELETKRGKLEKQKSNLIRSNKYLSAPIEIKSKLLEAINGKIEDMNKELIAANASFSLVDKKSAPVNPLNPQTIHTGPLYNLYDRHIEKVNIMKNIFEKLSKQGKYNRGVYDRLSREEQSAYDAYFPIGEGNKWNGETMKKRTAALQKALQELAAAQKKLEDPKHPGELYPRNALIVVKNKYGDELIDIDDFAEENFDSDDDIAPINKVVSDEDEDEEEEVVGSGKKFLKKKPKAKVMKYVKKSITN